jgi:hypothetical protein
MLCFLFVPAFDYKIYCLILYHLLKSTLHHKANACSIGTFIRFYMQSSLHSKANACNIGTFIRFYIQMQVQIKNKAFAYRFYRPFTQQCKWPGFVVYYVNDYKLRNFDFDYYELVISTYGGIMIFSRTLSLSIQFNF